MAEGGSGTTDLADSELRSALMGAWDEWTKEIHAFCEERTTPDQGGDRTDSHDDEDRQDWVEERKVFDIESESMNPDAASTIPMHIDFTGRPPAKRSFVCCLIAMLYPHMQLRKM